MNLLDRLSKVGSLDSMRLSESAIFNNKDFISTKIKLLNMALSGAIDGGLTSGLTVIAGPSKHFKSLMSLLLVKAYLDKYPDSVCLFYDSEFGITPSYLSSLDLDPKRFLHVPVVHIEQLKFDIAARLDEIKRGDKVIIFIDSIGNLASKKEVDDALEGKSVADMSRAKALKSLFRIITPHLTIKDLPCVVVNHTYKEIALYPKDVVSGGTGGYYAANTIWIISRSQEKEGTEVIGYNFTIGVEKSRFVKEKSKFPITVTFDGGINEWSGLMDIALETGHCNKPKNGWYTRTFVEADKNWRLDDTNCAEFWNPILNDTTFAKAIELKYTLGAKHTYIPTDKYDEEKDV